MQDLAKRLRKEREKRDWTHWMAAKELGVGRQTLVNLEQGSADPGSVQVRTALRIARAYGIPIEDFDS